MLEIGIIIFIMLIAMFLVLLEIFFLPGITIAGIGGAIFFVGGAIYAYSIDTTIGHYTLISSVIVFILIFAWLLRSKSFHRVALKAEIDSKLASSEELGIKVGDKGKTLSRLAPIGKARIQGITIEAKSTGEFIDEDTSIKVIRVDGYNVIVEPVEEIEE